MMLVRCYPLRLKPSIIFIVAFALNSGCEQKAGPSLPRSGILRCATLSMPPDVAKLLAIPHGFPNTCVKVEYNGAKQWFEITAIQWHKGEECSSCIGLQPLKAPLSHELAFGVRDRKDDKGNLVSEHVTLDGRRGSGANDSLEARVSVATDAGRAGITAINGRKWRTIEPKWPVEAAEDKTVVLWTVLIGGDPENDARTSIEELVKRVDDAWIFSIRLKSQQ